MSEPLNRRAVKIWANGVADVLSDARKTLDDAEFTAVVDVTCSLIAKYNQRRVEDLAGHAPLQPAQRVVGPRVVVELPFEGVPRVRFEGASRDEVARLHEWIASKYELVHLLDEARELAREGGRS